MNIAYMRVSTQDQHNDNQEFDIMKYCKQRSIDIDKKVKKVISSR